MIRIALLLLVAMLCMGSGTGVVATGGSSVSIVGGGGLTLLWGMDFEGTGCVDTNGSLSPNEDCAAVTGDADFPDINGLALEVDWNDASANESATGPSVYSASATDTTVDFRMNLASITATNASTLVFIASPDGDAVQNACVVYCQDATGYQCRINGDNSNSAYITGLSSTPDYYVRVRRIESVDTTTDCHLQIWSDNWGGATSLGAESVLDGNIGNGNTLRVDLDSGFAGRIVYDDVYVCDGDAGTTEGACDGS